MSRRTMPPHPFRADPDTPADPAAAPRCAAAGSSASPTTPTTSCQNQSQTRRAAPPATTEESDSYMTWFKVDDSFYDHPKVFDAPDCAVALWTRAGAWSARNLTDGFVPAGMPARLCDDHDTAIKELLRRGLWIRASGGFRFHDWAGYQPSKESVEALRAKRAEAGKRGGQAKAAKQNAGKVLASASHDAKQNAAPTRPVPKGRGGTGELLGDSSLTRASSDPPSPRCEKHHDVDDPPPCGPCADARRARTRWDLADSERRRTQPQCRTHRGQPAHNCGLCRAVQLAAAEENS